MNLTEEQVNRYSRHIILENVGGKGQEKLLSSSVLIIGAGGLGSPAALYLAAAGIGEIGIVDYDKVELSNLQRQIAHATADVGRPKVDSAKERMQAINPDPDIETYNLRLNAENIEDLIKEYDFIIDGTDNFPIKFLINDACVFQEKPFSHGGILRYEGQTMTYEPGQTCYRCIFQKPPPRDEVPTCSQAGILGAVAGMLGTIQAAEALKYILDTGKLLTNRLLKFDALEMNYRTIEINHNDSCAVCGDEPEITELQEYEQRSCEI